MGWFDRGEAHIYYEESGTGEPVLLLPGWGGTIAEFGALRETLASSFRVIAADVPGSGKSGPQPRTYTPSYYHDDAALFATMLEEVGAAPANVVGFSDGGEYALLMAVEYPGVVRSVTTWGAAGTLGREPKLADAMLTLMDHPIPPMEGFADYMRAAYGADNARIMSQSAARSFRAIMESGGDVSRSRAGEILVPALLIAGENDFLATPTLVADMANSIPNGLFEEAKGAGHGIHHEQPAWLTETIARWLSQVS